MPVRLLPDNKGYTIEFDWPHQTFSAIWQEGGSLLVFFQNPASFSLPQITSAHESWFKGPFQTLTPQVLSIPLAPGILVGAWKRDMRWYIRLRKSEKSSFERYAPHPMPKYLLTEFEGETTLVLPGTAHGDLFTHTINKVPYWIWVSDSKSFEYRMDTLDFDLKPTVLGCVIQQKSNTLQIQRGENELKITSPKGLLLSPEGDKTRKRDQIINPLYDFKKWAGDPTKPWLEREKQLEDHILQGYQTGNFTPLFNMAEFYIGTGFYKEALGTLKAMKERNPNLSEDLRYISLMAVASYLDGRYHDAVQYFISPLLEQEAEASIWLESAKVADETNPSHQKNYDSITNNLEFIKSYPSSIKNQLLLTGLESAASLRLPHVTFICSLDIPALTLQDQALVHFYQGDTHRQIHNTDEAIKSFEQAMIPHGKARLKAHLELMQMQLLTGEVKTEKAIELMELRRFEWRGDKTEIEYIAKLAELYLEQKRWRLAFDLLERLVHDFPGYNVSRYEDILRKNYKQIFMDQKHVPDPLEALSLHREFSEWAPSGDENDKTLQGLASRMLELNLLGPAISIIEEALKKRPSGELQNTLGFLYLLDHKPEKALELTNAPGETPEITIERRKIRAHALGGLGKLQELKELLKGDSSEEAQKILSVFSWNNGDWAGAGEAFLNLLGMKDHENDLNMIHDYAVTLYMQDNKAALQALKEKYGGLFKESPQKISFDLLTSSHEKSYSAAKPVAQQYASLQKPDEFMNEFREEITSKGLSIKKKRPRKDAPKK